MHFRDLGRPEASSEERRLDSMQARLDKIERDSQRWGIVGGVILAALSIVFVVVTMKKRPVQEMRANRYTLVDRAGAVRGYMATGEQGPSLVLVGKDSRARIMLAMNQDGLPEITMAGINGKDRVKVALAGDDGAEISLMDKRGRPRGWIGVDKDHHAGVNLYSTLGKPLASLSAQGTTTSTLTLFNRGGAPKVSLHLKGDEAGLMVSGDRGNSAKLAVADQLVPGLTLETGRGSLAQMLLSDKSGPRMILNDKERGTRGHMMLSVEGNMTVGVLDGEGNATVMGSKRIVIGKDQSVIWQVP